MPTNAQNENAQRVAEEFEALQSIYGNDFKIVETKAAWKNVSSPKECSVTVRALEDGLDAVTASLHFK